MKSRMRHMVISMAIAAVMSVFLPIWTFQSYAADGRIAFSDKTVSVGSEVEIKMKVTLTGGGDLSNATVMLSYDSAMLEFLSGTGASGGAGSVRVTVGGDTADAKELVSTLKFKAVRAGTSKISVNTQEVYDSSNQVVNISQLGSSAITVQAPANASTEAGLSDLKISPGTLTPEFSPDVFVYTANVDADVTKITVNAPAKDEKASVLLSGNEDLQPGGNQVTCRVTAEDGTTIKEYIITVTRAAGGGSQAGEVPAGSIAVETPAKTVTIIPLDEGVSIPEGFAECTIKIDGQEAQGWIWATDTEHKYCIFYGMNEAGEKDFYRYDLAEKTMQRYFQDPAMENNVSMGEFAKLAEEHNSLLEDYKLRLYIIIGLGAAVVILLLIVIALLSTRRRGGDDEYTNYEEKLNDRKESVRRASEGLPSQRSRMQADRQMTEPGQTARQPEAGVARRSGLASTGRPEAGAARQSGLASAGRPDAGVARRSSFDSTGRAETGAERRSSFDSTGRPNAGASRQSGFDSAGHSETGAERRSGFNSMSRPEEGKARRGLDSAGRPDAGAERQSGFDSTGYPETGTSRQSSFDSAGRPETGASRQSGFDSMGRPEAERQSGLYSTRASETGRTVSRQPQDFDYYVDGEDEDGIEFIDLD